MQGATVNSPEELQEESVSELAVSPRIVSWQRAAWRFSPVDPVYGFSSSGWLPTCCKGIKVNLQSTSERLFRISAGDLWGCWEPGFPSSPSWTFVSFLDRRHLDNLETDEWAGRCRFMCYLSLVSRPQDNVTFQIRKAELFFIYPEGKVDESI